jgi:2-polyprenyl-3-methyl-5-hydroxy-6-metoxy-1,4-benzoquinol methylase
MDKGRNILPPLRGTNEESMKYTLVKDDLGYMRCFPLPSQDELDKLYRDEFYTTAKPRYIERMEDDWEWWEAVYSDGVSILREILGEMRSTPIILDVGCGAGFFLKVASKEFYPEGIEPNKTAAEYAEHLNQNAVIFNSLDEYGDPDSDFKCHAVHLSEVLEHVRNPFQMLQDCADRLVDGGAICVVVPNEKFSPRFPTARFMYPHVFQPPQHINYFTFDTIEALMVKAGFEIYERSSTYPMETFLQIGLDYTKSEAIGRLCHTQRMAFDLSMTSAQRRKFYKELAAEGLGRECVIYGRKVNNETDKE